jgi:hypothetical protein
LQGVNPEQVTVEICRAEALDQRRGLTSELDEMWSYVRSKANPRWLWHAIDHRSGTVLAYVFGRRQDTVFVQLKSLLEPFGITRFYTDGWGAYEPMVLVSYILTNTIVLAGLIVMVMNFLQAGSKRATLPGTEESMITLDFITALFCQVDDHLPGIPKHPHATLWPSEIVTLGMLHALKGGGNRAFYRWLTRDYRALFPRLPERTRLFRLFRTHQDWTQIFLAAPTVLGVIDTYGIELIHPMREGRSPQQIGRKGLSNHRWIVGGKLCLLLNQWGLVVAWACATANVADNTFQWLIRPFEERMIILSDTAFHAAEGDPTNLKLCQRGEWQDRMLVETVLSMLTLVCHFKRVMHRVWEYFQARLAFTMAAFNVLVQWHGFQPNASGFVPLSIAEFSL